MKLGLQLFTVRKEAQKDLKATLIKVHELGIRYIEAARINFDKEASDAFVWANKEYGIEVLSTQIKFHILDEEFEKVLAFHKATNCPCAVISVIEKEYLRAGQKGMLEFCEKINKLALRFKAEGIQLCYHHHDLEFILRNGYMQMDTLIENLSENVKFIIDTYWATKSGICVPELLKKLSGRVYGLHLRDYGLVWKKFDRKPTDFALGEGVIDFEAVIKAAETYEVTYGAIEQKTKTPFEELKKSTEYLKKLNLVEF